MSEHAPRAGGEPRLRGVMRVRPEDFRVGEQLGFEPSGDGPHAFIEVEKRGQTTLALIDALARFAGVRSRDVGYSGLKDRDAVTRQWLSVPGQEDRDWREFDDDAWRVVQVSRNARKLRLGAHRGNAFQIVLREVTGDVSEIDERARRVASRGVPNYFGPQRFGRHGDNLRRARRLFVDGVKLGRRQRRFALSAARSLLFNRVLAERVRDGSWEHVVDGEIVCLDGSNSYFAAAGEDPEVLAGRLAELDVHPSGPLWGKGESADSNLARLERDLVSNCAELRDGLETEGLKLQRRALRLAVRHFEWQCTDACLSLQFELVRGTFATSVLHELVAVDDLVIPC